MTGPAPLIAESTPEERRSYVERRCPCIADCDLCGICASFHGRDAVSAYEDYVEGRLEFTEVSLLLRG